MYHWTYSVSYTHLRPNTPVNVIVGALIIKELFDYSDDEMVENLMSVSYTHLIAYIKIILQYITNYRMLP